VEDASPNMVLKAPKSFNYVLSLVDASQGSKSS